MSSLIPGNHKHLTLVDRTYIEEALNEARSFRAISRYLCKSPSTISDEVFKNRIVNSWNRGSFNHPYTFAFTGFDAVRPTLVRSSFFVIPAVDLVISVIKSVTALNWNNACTSAKLLLFVMAVINQEINAPCIQDESV